jgi:hypothetical protein
MKNTTLNSMLKPAHHFPYLISKKKLDGVIATKGMDSWEYWSQCVGKPVKNRQTLWGRLLCLLGFHGWHIARQNYLGFIIVRECKRCGVVNTDDLIPDGLSIVPRE